MFVHAVCTEDEYPGTNREMTNQGITCVAACKIGFAQVASEVMARARAGHCGRPWSWQWLSERYENRSRNARGGRHPALVAGPVDEESAGADSQGSARPSECGRGATPTREMPS